MLWSALHYHIMMPISEARSQSTGEWIRRHVKAERRYRPPRRGRVRKHLQREGKGIAGRFFQLLSGHATIGPYLAEKIKTIQSDKSWWCSSGERQPRNHLFVKCWAWAVQMEGLWRSVGKTCEWKHPRAPRVRLLFQDERTTPAVLNLPRGRQCREDGHSGTPEEDD